MTPEASVENTHLPLVQYVMSRMAVRPCCFHVLNQEEKTDLRRQSVSRKVTQLPKTVAMTSCDRSINDSYGPGCWL